MLIKTYLEVTETSEADFARKLTEVSGFNCAPALVWQWIAREEDPAGKAGKPIASKWAIPIEKVTEGRRPRHVTSPDVFPEEARA